MHIETTRATPPKPRWRSSTSRSRAARCAPSAPTRSSCWAPLRACSTDAGFSPPDR